MRRSEKRISDNGGPLLEELHECLEIDEIEGPLTVQILRWAIHFGLLTKGRPMQATLE